MNDYEIIDTNADNIDGCHLCGNKNVNNLWHRATHLKVKRLYLVTAMCYLLIITVLMNGCSNFTDRGTTMDDYLQKSLDEFMNRTIYTSLDVDTLRAIPDDKVEQSIVNAV